MGLIDNVNVNVGGNGNIVDTLSTYVTKLLKPNIVDGKNVLTQEMMSAQNTKYVIKYDYVLSEDITVPQNCVLEFDGGSISGEHTVTGNNTGIEAGLVKIFDLSLNFDGTFTKTPYNVKWFGAKGDGVTDDTVILRHCMTQNDVVIIPRGNYIISGTIDSSEILKCCWIGDDTIGNYSRWNIYSTTNIYCKGGNNNKPFLYFPRYVKNINVYGEVSDPSKRPIYDNSIGVQWGTPYRFMVDGVIENVTIQGFGVGINMQECGGTECSRLYLKGNLIGIDFTCEYVNDQDSGYNTTMTFNDCIINQSFKYAMIKHTPVLPSEVQKPTDIIIFNNGYIENNAIDNTTDCDILFESHATIKFDGFYTESSNDYFIKILDVSSLDIKGVRNWGINGIYCNGSISIYDSYLPNAVIYVNKKLGLINSEIKNIEIIRESEEDTHELNLNIIVSRIHDYNREEWLNYISLPTFGITSAFPTFTQAKGNSYLVKVFDNRSGQWSGIGIWDSQGHVGGPSMNNFIEGNTTFTLGVGPTSNRPNLQDTTRYGVKYYDTEKKRLMFFSSNNRWETADGMNADKNRKGIWNDKPAGLTTNDIGFSYFCTDRSYLIYWNGSVWVTSDGFTAGMHKGSSTWRPKSVDDNGILDATRDIGYPYFDTTLGKIIYVKEINNTTVTWVDATGTTV